jgi:mono/diheme cytochrome c family protein
VKGTVKPVRRVSAFAFVLLSKDTAGGNDEVIRGVINDGTPRMPGFRHYLDRPQVDSIIAYLKTILAAPATQTR